MKQISFYYYLQHIHFLECDDLDKFSAVFNFYDFLLDYQFTF